MSPPGWDDRKPRGVGPEECCSLRPGFGQCGLRSEREDYPSTLTFTIFLPARRDSEPSFTEATRSLVGAPSSLTAFCLTLREPSLTEVARPVWKRSLASATEDSGQVARAHALAEECRRLRPTRGIL